MLCQCIINSRLEVAVRLHENRLYEVRIHFGNQLDACPFQNHGDCGCLVTSQLEVVLYPRNKLLGLLSLSYPFLKYPLAETFIACAHKNDCAAVLNGMPGIVQRFLGLIEIQILWRAPL